MLQTFPRGRAAMKGGRSAMLQTFPLGKRSAILQIFRGKVCNVADLPEEGLQGGRSAIQHRDHFKVKLVYQIKACNHTFLLIIKI